MEDTGESQKMEGSSYKVRKEEVNLLSIMFYIIQNFI
jgi:hypothetical protein